MIEQLISRVFYARNVAHFEHWRATGAFELVGNIPAPPTGKGDVLKLLEGDAAWIEQNHEAICQGNRAVANLIDGVTDVYLSAIYKLRNLK